MKSLLDNISARRSEIKKSIESLKQEIKGLDADELAYKNSLNEIINTNVNNKMKRGRKSAGELSIKDMVLEVIKSSPGCKSTAKDIRYSANQKFNVILVRTNISTALSRLKNAGILRQENNFWILNSENDCSTSSDTRIPVSGDSPFPLALKSWDKRPYFLNNFEFPLTEN